MGRRDAPGSLAELACAIVAAFWTAVREWRAGVVRGGVCAARVRASALRWVVAAGCVALLLLSALQIAWAGPGVRPKYP